MRFRHCTRTRLNSSASTRSQRASIFLTARWRAHEQQEPHDLSTQPRAICQRSGASQAQGSVPHDRRKTEHSQFQNLLCQSGSGRCYGRRAAFRCMSRAMIKTRCGNIPLVLQRLSSIFTCRSPISRRITAQAPHEIQFGMLVMMKCSKQA